MERALELHIDNTYLTRVSGSWNIGENPNGGYLLSLAMLAIEKVTGLLDPLSVTAHFLRPGASETDALIDVHIVRSGRTMTTVQAVLRQEGKERLIVTAAVGELASEASASDYNLAPSCPEIPSPDDCLDRAALAQGVDLPLLEKVDVRIHPDDAVANPDGPARVRGWIRLRDGSAPTTRSLLIFADAFPPSLFSQFGRVGWVPTIELTVHVRARPSAGWIQAEFEVDDLIEGRFIESGTLWDSDGQVVARSRQLGLLRAF